MTTIAENVAKLAELEKVAYVDYVKSMSSSAIVALVEGGMEFEKAASIVEEAVQKDATAIDIRNRADVFEKVASHVLGLEARISELEKEAKEAGEAEVRKNDPVFEKLASLGFSAEEIEAMSESLPDSLIEKVASTTAPDNAPWGLGAGTGRAIEEMDPMVRFLTAE